MIRLIGVLSQGGVSIQVKSNLETKGDILLGALVEATRSLSTAMGSGEVRKLDFQDKKLIVTESKKGYTIVALVERAEDYIDTLVRIIADEIDKSEIEIADGCVTDDHQHIVQEILDTFIRHELNISLVDTLEKVWTPLKRAIKTREVAIEPTVSSETQMKERWESLKVTVENTIESALTHARDGDFDKACAASMDMDSPYAKMFCIKMGALALSMTRTCVPPIESLQKLADTLPEDDVFAQLSRAVVGRIKGEVSGIDYSHTFKHSIDSYRFADDENSLLLSFLFVDLFLDESVEFANSLIDHFKSNNYEMVANYIAAILERSALFDKLYSITSYDDFKDELGVWKIQIETTLEEIDEVLRYRTLRKFLKREDANEKGQSGALKLQNYITLLTAMAESPVLTVSERKEVLEEVLQIYQNYFKRLLRTDVPLFSYTVDSVFQSLGVANGEYYNLVTGEQKDSHLEDMLDFLRDILTVVDEERGKRYVQFSLFVVSNIVFPAFAMSKKLYDEELLLVLEAMRTTDVQATEGSMLLYPLNYATNLGNMMSTFAALASRLLIGTEQVQVMKKCVDVLNAVHTFFLSHGMVCRDDLIAATYHATQTVENITPEELAPLLRAIIALNRVAVQNPKRYDYEVAMMGGALIDFLVRSWRKLGSLDLREQAIDILETSIGAWKKYGFQEKAEELEHILSVMK